MRASSGGIALRSRGSTGQKAIVYRSKMNPALGRNFEAMDPLEWLARLADHIPDPGKHRTLAYGHYAHRARHGRPQPHPEPQRKWL